jgi:hypothetical protein
MNETADISDNRELTMAEYELVRWLLEHGNEGAGAFLHQLKMARVASRCRCGCASVNFSIAGEISSETSFKVLSDYEWTSVEGHLFGIFVFAKGNLLSDLDVWSIEGLTTPTTLPTIEDLRPLGIHSTKGEQLIENLLETSSAFQSLVERSGKSLRKPFPPAQSE